MKASPDLFDHAEQVAALRRDTGMALATAAQDAREPGWSDHAYAAILTVARRQEELFVDDVLAEITRKPAHHNAFGAVWMRAIRSGVIARTGRVKPSADPAKHSHQYPIYRSCLFKGGAHA